MITKSVFSGHVSFTDPTIYRQVSSVVTEAERELEALISIHRTLDQFFQQMEPYLLVALVKKKMPLVTGETAYRTLLFKFLMDPNTASLQSFYESEKCKNVTLEQLHAPEMELFIKIV